MSKQIDRLKQYIEESPFKDFTQFRVDEISEGHVEASIALLPFFRRYDGLAHGGFSAYLADSVMGFAALTLAGESETVYTVEMKISYLNPGKGKRLLGKGYVIKRGRSIHFCEGEIYGENEEGERYLICKASATMAVAPKNKPE